MGKTAAEIKARLVEMDKDAELFNGHLMALPKVVRPFLSEEMRARVDETEMIANLAIKADSHVIVTMLATMGVLDAFHDQLISHDDGFFRNYDYSEQLKLLDNQPLAQHDSSYYTATIEAIKAAWPMLDRARKDIIWSHVDKFYESYLAYAADLV